MEPPDLPRQEAGCRHRPGDQGRPADLSRGLGRPAGEARPRQPALPARVHLARRRSGAGKGTNTPFIAQTRDITAPPIVISSLLTSPQAVAIKNAGKMVGDREVIGLLFEELLAPQYHDGVIIDGFPRTKVQVECLKMFYHAMLELHSEYRSTPLARFFRKPMFRIALLFVSEEVSVQRQLKRGLEIQEHNRQVRETGIGKLLEERRHRHRPGAVPQPLPDVQGDDVRRPAVAAEDLPLPLHRRRGRPAGGAAEHPAGVHLPEFAGAEPRSLRADPQHSGRQPAGPARPAGTGRTAGKVRGGAQGRCFSGW